MFCTGCCVSDQPAFVEVDAGLSERANDVVPSVPAAAGPVPGEQEAKAPPASAVQVADAPKAPGLSTFVVTIDKQAPDTPLGLHLDLSDSVVVHVCGMRQGKSPVTSYNETVDRDLQINPGDYITRVNEVRGDAKKIIEEIQRATSLEIEVRRAEQLQAKIDKHGGPMGLELNYAMQGKSLVIDGVVDGAVKEWNKENPGKELRRGDRILCVDGQTGSAAELLQFIAKSNPVTFEISRPAGQ